VILVVIDLCGKLRTTGLGDSLSGHHMGTRADWMAFMSPGYAWSSLETCDDTAFFMEIHQDCARLLWACDEIRH